MKEFRKLIFISTGLLLSSLSGIAQVDEALLFSQTEMGGTARIQGVGGAQVALGGDMSAALSNPAGLGMFNKSVFTFSPALSGNGASATILGNTTDDSKLKFTVPHFGIVFNDSKGNAAEGPFRGGSFAISFSRIKDFNSTFTYRAENPSDDFFSFLYDQLNNGQTFYTDLAYEAYVLDEFEIEEGGETIYFLDYIDLPNGEPELAATITETVETSGAQNQWNFSYGANFNDKFFIGAGIGIPVINYEQEKSYAEFRSSDSALGTLYLNETVDISGIGINATFGMIYRPINVLQLGFSVATPSYYALNQQVDASITSQFNGYYYEPEARTLVEEQALSDIVIADYFLTTPLRLNLGAAFFVGKQGFLTADIGYVDYGSNKFASDDVTTTEEAEANTVINDTYTSAINLRVGGEVRVDMFRFRGGYGVSNNPYNSNVVDGKNQRVSVGAGIRTKKNFFDLALVHAWSESPYTPYGDVGPLATIENRKTTGQFTVGFNF